MRLSAFSARLSAAVGAGLFIPLLSAHVGSPDVFFKGAAGPYAIQVVVRPPDVVPGVAQVTVLATADVQSVSIRPVFWRAGSRGAPQADQMRRVEGNPPSWAGSLWLMANGAYTVDVIVNGAHGSGHVLVPVPSVARGRLDLDPKLAALLAVLGLVLVAGLVNIVHKAAGESLVDAYGEMDDARRRTARRASAVAIPVIALALFGGSRWWNAVDKGYERTIYETPTLQVSNKGGTLSLENPVLRRWSGRAFPMLRDHGKLMHLFLIRADDARAFAHLHPDFASDTSSRMTTVLPPLPAGSYHVFGDVVDETGFEHTAVATLEIMDAKRASFAHAADPDDAWYLGDATGSKSTRLEDGSTMTLEIAPGGVPQKGMPITLRVGVSDAAGKPIRLEPYLGMAAHAVVTRVDGKVFVHLHPMGTITLAAQEAFAVRDRGDTTAEGRLNMPAHRIAPAMTMTPIEPIEFPYAFPKNGAYRIFVQVKHNGRVQTGAFAVTVAEQTDRQ